MKKNRWVDIEEVQTDNCQKSDDYTTRYAYSGTFKYDRFRGLPDSSTDYIVIRIKFKSDTGRSGSWDDLSVEMFTDRGWVNIATDKHIPVRITKIRDGFQYNCRLNSLHDMKKLWVEDCKKYVENIINYM